MSDRTIVARGGLAALIIIVGMWSCSESLRAEQQATRRLAVNRALDLWVGSWTVADNTGKPVGTHHVTRSEGGFLITGKWQGVGGATETRLIFFDPAQRQWQQIRVGPKGSLGRYSLSSVEGRLRFHGESTSSGGQRVLQRETLSQIANGRWQMVVERSSDRGTTWAAVAKRTYTRSKNSATPQLELQLAINKTCPRSGKPIAANSLTRYRGRIVGFCNQHCRDDFATNIAARPDDRRFFDALIDRVRDEKDDKQAP